MNIENEVEVVNAFAFDMGRLSSLMSDKTRIVIVEAETPSIEGFNIRFGGRSFFVAKDRLTKCVKGPEQRPSYRIW